MASIFDAPTVPPLRKLLNEVRDGRILIPDFQRPFVWKPAQRLFLLDSIARGLPIGSLLVWRTLEQTLPTYRKLGPLALPEPVENGPRTFLIDGHQRLTTLFVALTSGPDPLEEMNEGDDRWPIFIDLEADPNEVFFVLPTRRLGRRASLVPTTVLLNSRALYTHQRALWDEGADDLAERLERISNAFKDYPVPIVPLITEDLTVVTTTFGRINTSGTKMSSSHLVMALAYGSVSIRKVLTPVVERFAASGWPGLDHDLFLAYLKLRFGLDIYNASPTDLLGALVKELAKRNTDRDVALRELIEESAGWFERAIKVFKGAAVFGSAALPYKYQLILMADALRQLAVVEVSESIQQRALYWFWQTTLAEVFTGATGSTIGRHGDELVAYLRGGAPLSLDGESIRRVDVHKRWGSVRILARTLAYLSTHLEVMEPAARLVSAHGASVVQRWYSEDRDNEAEDEEVLGTSQGRMSSARLAICGCGDGPGLVSCRSTSALNSRQSSCGHGPTVGS